ncbi:signal peptide peptidase SppA [soil metagenome]
MMAMDAELFVERRRLRRRVVFWRVASIVLFIAALLSLAGAMGGIDEFDHKTDHIARVRITGLITGDQDTLDLLDKIAKASAVKGLIIRIDSPGGTTAGSEAIYEKIREIAKAKPVVAAMDTVAASGGYITALAADHIVARGNTITGSIGVIFQWAEFSKLLDTLGVKMEEIKSGELKAEPSPFKPLSPQVRAVADLMIQDSFAWFMGLVAERRNLPMDRVRILSDGRVYTGRQALTEKLIDEVGGEDKAVDWLKTGRKLDGALKVVDWEVSDSSGASRLGFRLASGALSALGLSALAEEASIRKLDGLVAVWHPSIQ